MGSPPPRRAPQSHATPGRELLQAEGLDDVVVGTHLETEDPVYLVASGAHDDDGQVGGTRLPADQPADLQAVHPRQVQVQEHEIRSLAHGLDALLARPRDAHREPGPIRAGR